MEVRDPTSEHPIPTCGHPRSVVSLSDDGTFRCVLCEADSENEALRSQLQYAERALKRQMEEIHYLKDQLGIERGRVKDEAKFTNFYIRALHRAEMVLEEIAREDCACVGAEKCTGCIARSYKGHGSREPGSLVCVVDCPSCDAALTVRQGEDPGEFVVNAEKRR